VIVGAVKSAKAVIKAKKAEKILSFAKESCKMTKNAADTLDTLTDTMKAAAKWGDNPFKLVDGIKAETGSKAMKALETRGDFAKESKKAVWEMKAVSGADGIRLKTSVDESVSFFKQGFAGTDGVAKSTGKSGSGSNKILWGKWEDYKHVSIGNNEYAEVGERLYTRHAVARMQPSGMRYTNASAGGKVKASRIINVGELDYGRSISPNYIEDIINTGKVSTQVVDDVTRTVFSSGTVDVITEQNGKIVVTILTH